MMTDGAEVKICMGCYTLGIETTWALGKGCMLGGVAFSFAVNLGIRRNFVDSLGESLTKGIGRIPRKLIARGM